MTSNDNINSSELKLLLENHFMRTEKQFTDFQKNNAEFRLQMNNDFRSFTEKIEGKLDFVQSEMHQINNKITGLEHDVSNLQMWNYWTLSIIIAFAAMPHIIAGIKSLFSVVANGVAGILNLFRNERQ